MILKNPDNGAEIKTIITGQQWLVSVGSVKNYPEEVGENLKERYGFLEEVESEATLEEKDGVYKCSACEYSNTTKIAVLGHMRSHNKLDLETVEDAQPVGTVAPRVVSRSSSPITDADLPNGADKDGVTWYGEGVQEENNSFTRVRPGGQAHFIGGN